MTFSIGTANAGMYKCKDENGKTSYSQSPCVTEEATQEMTVKKDKQPAITTEEKLMRLKNDAAMRGIIGKQKAKEKALIDRQDRIAKNIKYDKIIKKSKEAKRKSDNAYYEYKAKTWNKNERTFSSYDNRQRAGDLADYYEQKAKDSR